MLTMRVDEKMAILMKHYEQMSHTHELVNKKNDEVSLKHKKNIARYDNILKETNNLEKENKKLEDYISEMKNYCAMIEKTKQENDYLQMVYDKNVSTISKLKEELSNNKQVPVDKLLTLDLDDDFLGFDSVSVSTLSKSEMQIDPQYAESYYGSRYHKLQEDSTDFHNAVNYLLDTMKRSNMVMETEINYLNSVVCQTNATVKAIKKLLSRIFQNDQEAILELKKKQYTLERTRLDSSCHLAALKLELKSLGNREKIKMPTYNYNNYSSWYLKKLSIQRLFSIWSKMINYHQNQKLNI